MPNLQNFHFDDKPLMTTVMPRFISDFAAIENEGKGYETKDVESLRKDITIMVNHPYKIKMFFVKNWQWLIGLLVGSGVIVVLLKLLR